MMENLKSLGTALGDVAWGSRHAPLLPLQFRRALSEEALPDWVSSELGFSEGATYSHLTAEFLPQEFSMTKRMQAFVVQAAKRCMEQVVAEACFPYGWPAGLPVQSLALRTRTRNTISRAGFARDVESLNGLRIKDVLRADGSGTITLLDLLCTAEAAYENCNDMQAKVLGTGGDGKTSISALLERCLEESWPYEVSGADPRFYDCDLPGPHLLSDEIEQRLNNLHTLENVAELPGFLKSIEEAQKRADEIRGLPIEDALLDLLRGLYPSDEEHVEALGHRLGWTGDGIKTLQESGEMVGLTRERIRQIESKTVKSIPKVGVYLPQLAAALATLDESAPLLATEVGALLKRQGISKKRFDYSGIRRACEVLGVAFPFKEENMGKRKLIVPQEGVGSISEIITAARTLAGAAGVSSINSVVSYIEDSGNSVERNNVRTVLMTSGRFYLVDEDWFFAKDVPDNRNRLLNIAKKMLAAISPQSIHDVRAALNGVLKWRGSTSSSRRFEFCPLPPIYALLEAFEKSEDFIVDVDSIRFKTPLSAAAELGETELSFVEIFHSDPVGVIDRRKLHDACIRRGMNESTFSLYTTYSPLIEHVGIELWKLRGSHVDSSELEAIRRQVRSRQRDKTIIDYGWDERGRLWIAARVDKYNRTSPVFGIPGAVKRFVVGKSFAAFEEHTMKAYGTVAVSEDASSYGYGKYVCETGLGDGDFIRAAFAIADERVYLTKWSE